MQPKTRKDREPVFTPPAVAEFFVSRLRPVIIVLLAITVLTLTVLPVSAWVLNRCKYSGSNPTIHYKFYDVASVYQDAFQSGQAAWDATSAPGYFKEVWGWDPNLEVYDEWSQDTAWAWASGGCPSGTFQTWYGNETKNTFNMRTMADLSATEKKIVAIHEMGHSYGLAHSSLGCGANEPVMRSDATWVLDNCGNSNAPYANDVAGVNAQY
jgi:hypothetical protein